MHSWRVLLLPFLEQQPLYDQYDFDEPWDGPKNIKLLDSMPPQYSCPSAPRSPKGRGTSTSYVAVVGPTAAWPGASARSIKEFMDGTSHTILVVEHNKQNISWLEPRDLELGEAIELLGSDEPEEHSNHTYENFFYQYSTGRNVAFVDASIRYIDDGLSGTVWSSLLEVDDGASWDEDQLDRQMVIDKRLKIGNCIRLSLFLLLTVFPLPWVWLNPTSQRTAS